MTDVCDKTSENKTKITQYENIKWLQLSRVPFYYELVISDTEHYTRINVSIV